MDLSCIISSGDLELYVLGMLPENEARQVEQLISIFPEVKEEIDRISKSFEAVANASTLAPSAAARENIFHTFSELKNLENPTEQARPEFQDQPEQIRGRVFSMKNKRVNYLAAASFIGLALAVTALIFLANQNKSNNERLAAMEKEMAQQQQKTIAYNQMLKIISDENFSEIKLNEVAGKPKAFVKVFWNKASQEVYVIDVSLPAAPAGKQYQLWAIVDGKPVSAGMLEDSKQAAQKMQNFNKADAFAITLEKTGGSTTPTLEQMFVMGKTS